ncbi:hypothetical protein [Bifidobacterium cuniculi]|uniref:Uncharacterized protein n=1 Tax=Bifidobacterium cuniculi TaxID=1688 RepID=A0A087B4M2_9BIFI|nr:hypothetical protein [Bifidobacterium cuniculi]KFI65972.1 hypothetical protein BCUN_0472 [Bifidobacterium cuniculi]
MGALVLICNLRRKAAEGDRADTHPAGASLFGVLSGLMVGVGGLSGGTTTVVLAVMSAVGFTTHLLASTIAWQVGATLTVGAVIGRVLTPAPARPPRHPSP